MSTKSHGAATAILALDEYRRLLKGLAMPSVEQMHAFAHFVSGAHSWYKHLPLLPPGVPFCFFLDPLAGMQRILHADGRVEFEERQATGLHYSWLPTREYRERFGCLAFAQAAGTQVAESDKRSGWRVSSDSAPVIYDESSSRLVKVPLQVLEAGTAHASGLIHVLGADYLDAFLYKDGDAEIRWPEESGGYQALTKIRERIAWLSEDYNRRQSLSLKDPRVQSDLNLIMVDYPLYELVLPERMRQLEGMVAAMSRVKNLVS